VLDEHIDFKNETGRIRIRSRNEGSERNRGGGF